MHTGFFLSIWAALCILGGCSLQHDISHKALYAYQDPQTELWGFQNSVGTQVISARYENIFFNKSQPCFVDAKPDSIPHHMAAVEKDRRIWWIDRSGKPLFESYKFDNGPDYFEEGLSRIIQNDKFGFINKDGHIIIEPKYDFASPFRGGCAYVCQGCWRSFPSNTKFPVVRLGFPEDPEHVSQVVGGRWGAITSLGTEVVTLKLKSYKEVDKALRRLGFDHNQHP